MKIPFAALALAFLASSALAADIPSAPVFQVRLVVDAPSADSEQMTLTGKEGDHSYTNVFYVQKRVLLDQTALQSASVVTDALGSPVIELALTKNGSKLLAEVTRENIGKRLAIIINGKLHQAPVIRTEIGGGKAQITGSFSPEEAQTLAKQMNDALDR